ncbi:AAA family ATPase [Pontiella sulfatireligans]|uniref:ATPase AAA-type core domain-containing protein n=1 Tax=Pontiella sulfatireligans TaxID=2750658 RepID=A0A6C2UR31_9BACT|nr:AAA family ATPase [Pontiella sulfatireligans]VGO21717.1 hypothetical protein SCARR_03791 [Pontiella sulfatireligans]
MKYFSKQIIDVALKELVPYKTFFGITFLVAKAHELPVGDQTKLKLDTLNREFMDEHYRIHPDSEYYLRVFKFNSPEFWLTPKYPETGLQSINTRSFKEVFLHTVNTDLWGWDEDYISLLSEKLHPRGKMPLAYIVIWICRNVPWDESWSIQDIIKRFIEDYHLTQEELSTLFDTSVLPELNNDSNTFQPVPVKWNEVLERYPRPPDVKQEKGGILSYLETTNLGPADSFQLAPKERINVITGDNGLGKTFLFDIAFWAMTQEWPRSAPIYPSGLNPKKTEIKHAMAGENPRFPHVSKYNYKIGDWQSSKKRATLPGLVLYVQSNGDCVFWDPVGLSESKHYNNSFLELSFPELWDGKPRVCEGLIRDWVKWQHTVDSSPFMTLKDVLIALSPPDLGGFEIRNPIRLNDDPREIPTLSHTYGEVPITKASAGVKRILSLAYAMIWFWEEHKVRAKTRGLQLESQMVILIDEIDAHLHPKWQRTILPSILKAINKLHTELDVQLLVATHSPFVVASLENLYTPSKDGVFNFKLTTSGISLEMIEFINRGPIGRYLTSTLFDLGEPRSNGGEKIIADARRLIDSGTEEKLLIQKVHDNLQTWLADDDPFWPEWLFFSDDYLED